MTSQAQIAELLQQHNIPFVAHSHEPAKSLEHWVEILRAGRPAPVSEWAPTKSLVLKPKGGAVTNPILVVALQSSAWSINPLVKQLGNKEARVAADDGWKAALGVDKIDGAFVRLHSGSCLFGGTNLHPQILILLHALFHLATPFALGTVQDKSAVTVVIDSDALTSPGKYLAFRNFSSDSTLFIQAAQLRAFLSAIAVTFTELKLADFAAPASVPKSDASKGAKAQAPKVKAEVAKADAADG